MAKFPRSVLTFTFHFLSFPLVLPFLPCVFSFAGDLHVVDFNMVGNVFEKA